MVDESKTEAEPEAEPEAAAEEPAAKPAAAPKKSEPISDTDRDSLHILPLSIVPIETPGLAHARLIKNVRLDTVVELFNDEASGSGQMDIEDLGAEFGWPEGQSHPDLDLMRRLGLLHSYDVYSLRILLRKLGIEVNNQDALKLSPSMGKALTAHMSHFTRPLIQQIFGSEDLAIQDFSGVIALFRDPDVAKAREKLEIMATKLDIGLEEVPKFLEDYGDIFLSLSYYKRCLDKIEPVITEFLEAMLALRDNWQLRSDQNLMNTCKQVQKIFNQLMANITGRFESFDRSTENLWDNISADRFRKIKKLIENYHTTMGGTLCSLSVKMDAWARLFPNEYTGGPVKRGEFIMSEIKQGLDKIQKIEEAAPIMAQLN